MTRIWCRLLSPMNPARLSTSPTMATQLWLSLKILMTRQVRLQHGQLHWHNILCLRETIKYILDSVFYATYKLSSEQGMQPVPFEFCVRINLSLTFLAFTSVSQAIFHITQLNSFCIRRSTFIKKLRSLLVVVPFQWGLSVFWRASMRSRHEHFSMPCLSDHLNQRY